MRDEEEKNDGNLSRQNAGPGQLRSMREFSKIRCMFRVPIHEDYRFLGPCWVSFFVGATKSSNSPESLYACLYVPNLWHQMLAQHRTHPGSMHLFRGV